ncbi:alpha/beta hydrolase [Streptomyces dioscori]|uniref:Alpha/beta hydrolase n=1 Tax=Streptomyces dioscori TaxID=2109333 RepID=A0A2P8QAI6_9ACTN|nr:alpha/beta hydrolase [Streptomyces dioscori]PSM43262.1 alpha/beta hydrolase [Streptomyces dioscori]
MISRRKLGWMMTATASGAVALAAPGRASAAAFPAASNGAGAPSAAGLGPVRHVRTDVLRIAYHVVGPTDGTPVILLHGWPFSPVGSYASVAPMLAEQGYRCYIPYLRGHGETRFLRKDTVRSGQQGALGADLVDFMDALGIHRAVFAGYDWGGRAANVAAALWPERCIALVSVNNYLIQNIAAADVPLAPSLENGYWYFFYFLTERGRAGLRKDPKEFARVVWHRNSPEWQFSEAELDEAASLWTNPDYVDVVIHGYRHRLGAVPGDPRYARVENRLAAQPPIPVPTVTLDGQSDGVTPPTDGSSTASHFTGARVHHIVPNAGHDLPQEQPGPFASAVREAVALSHHAHGRRA